MLIPIVCFTCGCPIGDKEDLFNYLKVEKIQSQKDKLQILNNNELDCSDILDKLDIVNDCCRMHFISSMLFTDYY